MLNTMCKDVVTERATTSLLAAAILTIAGCAVPEHDTPGVGISQEEIIIPNIIIPNIIIPNIIIPNGTNTESTESAEITFNGVSFNPEHASGISVGGLGINEVALDGLRLNDLGARGITFSGEDIDAEQESNLLLVLRYAVECALSAEQSVTIYHGDGVAYQYSGSMGLGPEWQSGPLSRRSGRYVSACLAARSNADGKSVHVSLRGGGIPTTASERAVYAHYEGAFWGDVFGPEPHLSTCTVDGGGISGRVCTTGECGFEFVGECSEICARRDAADGSYSDCKGDAAVISTFLPITERTDFGKKHSCMTDDDGVLWCWGDNDAGQLGDGTRIDRPTPAPRIIEGSAVVELAGGAAHTCARRDNGRVWCAGDNSHGQIGSGSSARQVESPEQVSALGADVMSLAAGSHHTCALKSEGSLHCWGDNFHGQLGDGSRESSSTPVEVTALGTSVVRVAMGESARHTCVVAVDGGLYCWGWNSAGQVGDGTFQDRSTPVRVAKDAHGNDLDEVTDLCTGWLHTCARRGDGEVWCFGSNHKGRLGNPEVTAPVASHPVRVSLPGPAAQGGLSCGTGHTCAALEDGSLYCWGDNGQGQLGSGSYDADGSAAPTPVVGLASPVESVSADAFHTCATLSDQSMYCWGHDRDDMLFSGSTSATPVQFSMPTLDSYAPAGFTVSFNVDTGANKGSWDRHLSSKLAGYEVYRNGSLLASLGAGRDEGVDRGLAPGLYCYKMRAVFKDGTTSPFTQEICGVVN